MAIPRKKPLETGLSNHGSVMLGRKPRRRLDMTDHDPSQDKVDESSADSFPASDPPSWTVITGIGSLR